MKLNKVEQKLKTDKTLSFGQYYTLLVADHSRLK